MQELEEKFKQTQFKQYLNQNSQHSQYEFSVIERPYSRNSETYKDVSIDSDPTLENFIPKPSQTSQNKYINKSIQPLQVNYYGNKPPGNIIQEQKKGPFNIVKKRKLYNDKQFQDF